MIVAADKNNNCDEKYRLKKTSPHELSLLK
jgi:hypothetical protein